MAETKLVSGVFKTRQSAGAVVDALLTRGYSRDDISVLMSDETRDKEFVLARSHAAEGAGIGGVAGGTVGAVIAGIAAAGTSIMFPGIGLVIAGPIIAAIAGSGVGGAAGGVVGGLIGAGFPEEHARLYESALRTGGIVVAVDANLNKELIRLEGLLRDLGAEAVRTT
jgi:hypothetical protein